MRKLCLNLAWLVWVWSSFGQGGELGDIKFPRCLFETAHPGFSLFLEEMGPQISELAEMPGRHGETLLDRVRTAFRDQYKREYQRVVGQAEELPLHIPSLRATFKHFSLLKRVLRGELAEGVEQMLSGSNGYARYLWQLNRYSKRLATLQDQIKRAIPFFRFQKRLHKASVFYVKLEGVLFREDREQFLNAVDFSIPPSSVVFTMPDRQRHSNYDYANLEIVDAVHEVIKSGIDVVFVSDMGEPMRERTVRSLEKYLFHAATVVFMNGGLDSHLKRIEENGGVAKEGFWMTDFQETLVMGYVGKERRPLNTSEMNFLVPEVPRMSW